MQNKEWLTYAVARYTRDAQNATDDLTQRSCHRAAKTIEWVKNSALAGKVGTMRYYGPGVDDEGAGILAILKGAESDTYDDFGIWESLVDAVVDLSKGKLYLSPCYCVENGQQVECLHIYPTSAPRKKGCVPD